MQVVKTTHFCERNSEFSLCNTICLLLVSFFFVSDLPASFTAQTAPCRTRSEKCRSRTMCCTMRCSRIVLRFGASSTAAATEARELRNDMAHSIQERVLPWDNLSTVRAFWAMTRTFVLPYGKSTYFWVGIIAVLIFIYTIMWNNSFSFHYVIIFLIIISNRNS